MDFVHCDVIKWKHFPRYWPFVQGIVTGEFPAQRPVTRSFDVFFDLHLNKWLSQQRWGWWFETSSCPLWRHGNASISPQSQCKHNRWCPDVVEYMAAHVYQSRYQAYGHWHSISFVLFDNFNISRIIYGAQYSHWIIFNDFVRIQFYPSVILV